MLDNIWYNTGHAKPEELRTYDDLLNPKWKGKIAFWDPRSAGGAALGIWGYLWLTKGEGYLRKLAQQNLLLVEDRRLVADSLARAKVAVAIGATYYSYASFIKAGLPVKPLPPSKEGTFVSRWKRRAGRGQESSSPQRGKSLCELAFEQRRPEPL